MYNESIIKKEHIMTNENSKNANAQGFNDAADGVAILESDYIKTHGLLGECAQYYLEGYSQFTLTEKESKDNIKKIKSTLLDTIKSLLPPSDEDCDDEDRDEQGYDPQSLIYGSSLKRVRTISLGSSIGLRVEYYQSSTECSFDDIESAFIVNYGFEHVEIELDEEDIQALYNEGVF